MATTEVMIVRRAPSPRMYPSLITNGNQNSHTGCPQKMYHICFAHSFHTFLRSLLKHTSKDSQIHGDLLTPLPDSVTCPWRSRCHVLEMSTVLGHAQRCSASGLLGLVSTCGGGNSPDGSTNSQFQNTYIGFLVPSGTRRLSRIPLRKNLEG